jgi:hypothetical protein
MPVSSRYLPYETRDNAPSALMPNVTRAQCHVGPMSRGPNVTRPSRVPSREVTHAVRVNRAQAPVPPAGMALRCAVIAGVAFSGK